MDAVFEELDNDYAHRQTDALPLAEELRAGRPPSYVVRGGGYELQCRDWEEALAAIRLLVGGGVDQGSIVAERS